MRASTKAAVLFTVLSLSSINPAQMNGRQKSQNKERTAAEKTVKAPQAFAALRSAATFGQPISEKRTQMPAMEISPQARKWVIEAFLEQVDSMRAEAGVNGALRWDAVLTEGAQAFADTLTSASDGQWRQWNHTLGGPMAVHTGKYGKRAGCGVLAECMSRGWHGTDPREFGENEWRQIGARAAFLMKLSKNQTAHYAALMMDAKENKIGMGLSMHTQTVGEGANAPIEWVSDLVFWIGHH